MSTEVHFGTPQAVTCEKSLDFCARCHLAFDEEDKEKLFLVSITHLAFDRRLPVARKIAAYQKHRINRLRAR